MSLKSALLWLCRCIERGPTRLCSRAGASRSRAQTSLQVCKCNAKLEVMSACQLTFSALVAVLDSLCPLRLHADHKGSAPRSRIFGDMCMLSCGGASRRWQHARSDWQALLWLVLWPVCTAFIRGNLMLKNRLSKKTLTDSRKYLLLAALQISGGIPKASSPGPIGKLLHRETAQAFCRTSPGAVTN